MPCQGNFPLIKYNKTYPADSKSSFLLSSYPFKALIEEYLAVPINLPL